jgi:hypothetical protein
MGNFKNDKQQKGQNLNLVLPFLFVVIKSTLLFQF